MLDSRFYLFTNLSAGRGLVGEIMVITDFLRFSITIYGMKMGFLGYLHLFIEIWVFCRNLFLLLLCVSL